MKSRIAITAFKGIETSVGQNTDRTAPSYPDTCPLSPDTPHNPTTLQKVWQWWLTELKFNNDPKIWNTVDRSGNTWWHAYNPATGCRATRESEVEILEWLDKRITDE